MKYVIKKQHLSQEGSHRDCCSLSKRRYHDPIPLLKVPFFAVLLLLVSLSGIEADSTSQNANITAGENATTSSLKSYCDRLLFDDPGSRTLTSTTVFKGTVLSITYSTLPSTTTQTTTMRRRREGRTTVRASSTSERDQANDDIMTSLESKNSTASTKSLNKNQTAQLEVDDEGEKVVERVLFRVDIVYKGVMPNQRSVTPPTENNLSTPSTLRIVTLKTKKPTRQALTYAPALISSRQLGCLAAAGRDLETVGMFESGIEYLVWLSGSSSLIKNNGIGEKVEEEEVFWTHGLPVLFNKQTEKEIQQFTCKNCTGKKPHARLSPTSKLQIISGQKGQVKCHVTGKPLPYITWFKNDVPLVESKRIEFQRGAVKLLVRHVDHTDAGQYKCQATNIIGSANTSTLTVRVEHASYPAIVHCTGVNWCLNDGKCFLHKATLLRFCLCSLEYAGQRCEERPYTGEVITEPPQISISNRGLIIIGIFVAILILLTLMVIAYGVVCRPVTGPSSSNCPVKSFSDSNRFLQSDGQPLKPIGSNGDVCHNNQLDTEAPENFTLANSDCGNQRQNSSVKRQEQRHQQQQLIAKLDNGDRVTCATEPSESITVGLQDNLQHRLRIPSTRRRLHAESNTPETSVISNVNEAQIFPRIGEVTAATPTIDGKSLDYNHDDTLKEWNYKNNESVEERSMQDTDDDDDDRQNDDPEDHNISQSTLEIKYEYAPPRFSDDIELAEDCNESTPTNGRIVVVNEDWHDNANVSGQCNSKDICNDQRKVDRYQQGTAREPDIYGYHGH